MAKKITGKALQRKKARIAREYKKELENRHKGIGKNKKGK